MVRSRTRSRKRDLAWEGTKLARLRSAAVWVVAIFLAAAFVAIGISKLEGAPAMRWGERFGQWGYPANARYVVGIVEVLGGLGVLIPRCRRAAALILGALMMGALCTHLLNAEFRRVIPPLVFGALAFLMWRSRRRTAGEEAADRPSGV
jgi:uncharacterized membrane protein YphA (DoxX/SURF4 family)